MDPLTLSACIAAVAGVGGGWRWRRRAGQAEAEAVKLRGELQAARHAASHDPLTGLPNRRAFYQIGAAMFTDPAQHPLFVVVLDLDDFKQINDSFGHAVGDEVLVAVARRFESCAGPSLVARLGGDEFAGLFTSPTPDCGWLAPAADRLAEALATPMRVADRCMIVTASVGLAPATGCAHLSEAVRQADAAMYDAKHRRIRTTCTAPLAPAAIEDYYQSHRNGRGPAHDRAAPAHDRTLSHSTDPAKWTVRHLAARRRPPLQLTDLAPSAETGG